jgi:diphthine synthase
MLGRVLPAYLHQNVIRPGCNPFTDWHLSRRRRYIMLVFIGLGLYDILDVSGKGLACIRQADRVYLETYTSQMMGTDHEEMERYYGKPVHPLSREDVEQYPDSFLSYARDHLVAFLTGGDPMVSTTHIDLRIRAREQGIETGIIHGASIQTAVSGLTGLQNYRFGKSCSLPFPYGKWFPMTPMEVIAQNLSLDLHTLVYLDITANRFMTVQQAIDLIEQNIGKTGCEIPLYVGIARAGSLCPVVAAGTAEQLAGVDFGSPLHILVIPGPLHLMERSYLELFGGLC